MNEHIIKELDAFAVRLRSEPVKSFALVATFEGAGALSTFSIKDFAIYGLLEYVKYSALATVTHKPMLESADEENDADRQGQTEVQTREEDVEPLVREARPEAS